MAAAVKVAAFAAVRRYVEHLATLAGKTIAPSALLPPWATPREFDPPAPIPRSSRSEDRADWVVDLATSWKRGLEACVEVELMDWGHGRFAPVWPCGTLARLWVRGHLHPRGGRA